VVVCLAASDPVKPSQSTRVTAGSNDAAAIELGQPVDAKVVTPKRPTAAIVAAINARYRVGRVALMLWVS